MSEILNDMDEGDAAESAAAALDWLAGHGGQFGQFIGGALTDARGGIAVANPATGAPLAMLTDATTAEADAAIAAARTAQGDWARAPASARAAHLAALAAALRSEGRRLALLTTLTTGRTLRSTLEVEMAGAAECLERHAARAALLPQTCPDSKPLGVCGLILPARFPVWALLRSAGPALAAGNTLVVSAAPQAALPALLFAEICRKAGLPAGVVNVLTETDTGAHIAGHAGIDRLVVAGPALPKLDGAEAERGRVMTEAPHGPCWFIVDAEADIEAAIADLVDAAWGRPGPATAAGLHLLVQEGIAETFHARLQHRIRQLSPGDPLSPQTDFGPLTSPDDIGRLKALVESAREDGEVFQPDMDITERDIFPPTLVTGLSPASPAMQAEDPGPVLLSKTFRTADEAVQMVNAAAPRPAASLWSESLTTAFAIAPKLTAGTVWINAVNPTDPNVRSALEDTHAMDFLRPKSAPVADVAPDTLPPDTNASGMDDPATAISAARKAQSLKFTSKTRK
ncbi:Aldehyde dehydrogenase [Rhodovulum sp. P5]|nr:Aldehyde dehydrogenase [Rhodovulum sp. P5]